MTKRMPLWALPGAQGGSLTTSRRLEAAGDSLTDGCAARILGDEDCDQDGSGVGRVTEESRRIVDGTR